MKYRAKETIEAVQLKDPLEVANWFARVLPEWRFFNVNDLEYRVVLPDRSLPTGYVLDGRWMILSEGDTKPFVISDEFFRLRFEPVPSPFASGGYVGGPSRSVAIKDGCVALKKEVSAAELLKGM